mmetsp:Transcript_63278/g.141043  ORF Transcript_63278/g.141043 Transcript_63278/m.141043 type:complete len:231 (+) Transcript_63278:1027-1719(+)
MIAVPVAVPIALLVAEPAAVPVSTGNGFTTQQLLPHRVFSTRFAFPIASRRDEVHRRHEEEVYKMRRRKRLQEIRNRQKRGEFISDEQIKMMLDNFDYDYLEDTNFQLQDEQDAIDFLERLERIERADGQAAGDEEVLLASAEGELIDIHIVDDENEGGVEVQTTPSERVGEVEEEQVQGSVADETEEDPVLEDEVSVIENLDLVSAVVPSTTTTGPLTAADKDQSSGQR